MEQDRDGSVVLPRVLDALGCACRRARDLIERVERMESIGSRPGYSGQPRSYSTGDFYVASTFPRGLELDEPLDLEHLKPADLRKAAAQAIDATLALRASVYQAIDSVVSVADLMDGSNESVDHRWTVRTIIQLRGLLSAALRGHGPDAYQSALPMIGSGVPDALCNASELIWARMEEVKSAILAGVKRQPRSTDPPSNKAVTSGDESGSNEGEPSDPAPEQRHVINAYEAQRDVHTPADLRSAIEDNPAHLDSLRTADGDGRHDDALRDAARWRRVAVDLRVKDPSLPPVPDTDDLAMLRQWCIDAERPSHNGEDAKPRRQRKDSGTRLKGKARRELVLNHLNDIGVWDDTLKELRQHLRETLGVDVSESTLSRYMKNTRHDRKGRPRGAVRRSGKQSGIQGTEREAVADEGAADLSGTGAYTMPDDPDD